MEVTLKSTFDLHGHVFVLHVQRSSEQSLSMRLGTMVVYRAPAYLWTSLIKQRKELISVLCFTYRRGHTVQQQHRSVTARGSVQI